MAITVPTGFPTNSNGTGLATLSVTPVNVGDILIVTSMVASATLTLTSVTGGGCSEMYPVGIPVVDSTNAISEETWFGIVTTTGATSLTFTWSATNSVSTEFMALSLHSGLTKTLWGVVATGGLTAGSGTVITYPTLTSNAVTLQAYFGYGRTSTSGSAGATSGFTYSVTGKGNVGCYNVGIATSSAISPTAVTTSGNTTTTGTIFSAVGFEAPSTFVRTAVKRASFR